MKAHKPRKEGGVALVEMAIVMPLFILLLFGIMEAGWVFSQQVEVRNAAREGARLAVVDFDTAANMRIEVCNRAPLSSERAFVQFTEDPAADTATVRVEQTYQSLTGVIPSFNGITIGSTVVMRLERSISWTDDGLLSCTP